MKFLEKTLEDIIFNNITKVHEKGLNFLCPKSDVTIHRQVQLGNYGIADLVTVQFRKLDYQYKEVNISIIECKLDKIDLNAYQQTKRYKAAIQDMLDDFDLSNTTVEIQIVLIGSEFQTNGDFPYVYRDDADCICYTYSYGFEGITFKRITRGWQLTDPNLPTNKAKRLLVNGYKDFLRTNLNKTPLFADEQL